MDDKLVAHSGTYLINTIFGKRLRETEHFGTRKSRAIVSVLKIVIFIYQLLLELIALVKFTISRALKWYMKLYHQLFVERR